MSVTLSVATSRDGYIDDATQHRLVISTPEDWEAVYAMREAADAIVIGGQTLRRDNPSLRIKSVKSIANRVERGAEREPARVIISGRGEIPRESRILHCGEGRVIIFSNIERSDISNAEVIVAPIIDAAFVVTELEKRGLCEIFVEGGARILNMFLDEGVVDTLRVAKNTEISVNDVRAVRFDTPEWVDEVPGQCERFGDMDVTTYYISDIDDQRDCEYIEWAIDVSRKGKASPSCYRVGAVVVTTAGEIFDGYTLETSATHHAEQAAITKAQEAGVDLRGATIYSSMEPCSKRASEPVSCSRLIMELGISRVVFALYEPSNFVECQGAYLLRQSGVEVRYMGEYAKRVRQINAHVLE